MSVFPAYAQSVTDFWHRLTRLILTPMAGSFAATGWSQLATAVSGIFAARSLGPENRGNFALLTVACGIVVFVVSLGMPRAATYFVSRDPGSARAIMKSLSKIKCTQIIVGTMILALVLWIMTSDSPHDVRMGAFAIVFVPTFSILNGYAMASVQGVAAFRRFNLLRPVPATSYALAAVVLIASGSNSLMLFAAAWAASNGIGAVVASVLARSTLASFDQPELDLPSRREILRFGSKGFIGAASPIESFRVDQVFAGIFLSPVALGVYVAAQAFLTLPRLVATSVAQIGYPQIARQDDDTIAKRNMWGYVVLSLIVSLAVLIPIWLAAPLAVDLAFGNEFEDAVTPLRILLFGSLLSGFRVVLGEGMRGRGFPGASTMAEMISWAALALLLVVTVRQWELEGLAVAVVGSSIVSLLALLFIYVRGERARDPMRRRL